MVTLLDSSSLSSFERTASTRRATDTFADRAYRYAFLEPSPRARTVGRAKGLEDDRWERDQDERRPFGARPDSEPGSTHFDAPAGSPLPAMATWDELELRREFGIGDPFEARVSTPRGRRRAILDDGAIVPSAAPTGAYGSDLSPGDLGRIARRQTPPLAYYAPDLSIGGYPEFIERSRLPLHGGMVVVRFSDKALAIANGAHADLV